jgi:prolyl oligopeptidase
MKATFRILVTLTAAMAAALAGVAAAQDAGPQRLAYPQARRTDFVDTYHGVKVADPYRWMEELDSPETRAWVEAESKLTTSYLEAIPGRAAIAKRLTDLWNYERCTVPFVRGQRTFFTCNSGLQQQNVLYVVDKPGTEPRTLLDPNGLSKDGTVALAGTSVSDDGRLLAYGLSSAGSDWQVW